MIFEKFYKKVFSVPVGIGRANFSGEDIYMSAMKGKCLHLLHVYHDYLWTQGDKNIPLPLLPSTFPNKIDEKILETKQEQPENKEELSIENVENQTESLENLNLCEETNESMAKNEESQVDHEKILFDSFLTAVKFKSKEIKLPIIVSTFMKLMQTCW